jgi:type II secretory pathway component PulF
MSGDEGHAPTAALGMSAGDQVIQVVARATAAGLPLAQALEAYSADFPRGYASYVLRGLSRELQNGVPFEQAIARTRPALPEYVGGLVEAAAASGKLALVLEQHLHAARRTSYIRFRFWMSAAYPLVLLSVSIALLALMLVVWVPQMEGIFKDFGVPLPLLTKWTIGTSQALVAALPWWPIVLAVLIGLTVLVYCVRFLPGRPARVRLWQAVPLFGSASRSVGLSEFCGLLALLIECRLPLPKALRLTAGAVRDPNLAEGSRKLAEQCEGGLPPDQEIAYMPNFPDALAPVFRWEGRPDAFVSGLRAAAELYAAQARVRTWVAGSFIQPIVLALIVTLVGGVTITIFLPLFALLQSLT